VRFTFLTILVYPEIYAGPYGSAPCLGFEVIRLITLLWNFIVYLSCNSDVISSSAPEQRENFTLHIRGVGQWTNRLYSYVEEKKRVEGIQSRQMSRKR